MSSFSVWKRPQAHNTQAGGGGCPSPRGVRHTHDHPPTGENNPQPSNDNSEPALPSHFFNPTALPQSGDLYDPRNFLLCGGCRALDVDRARRKADAALSEVKDLKASCQALASRLAQARDSRDRAEWDLTSLRQDLAKERKKNEKLKESADTEKSAKEHHRHLETELQARVHAEQALRESAESELGAFLARQAVDERKAAAEYAALRKEVRRQEAALAAAKSVSSHLQRQLCNLEGALSAKAAAEQEACAAVERAQRSEVELQTARQDVQRVLTQVEATTQRVTWLEAELKDCQEAAAAAGERHNLEVAKRDLEIEVG
jgi:chromosome segregation ATPase